MMRVFTIYALIAIRFEAVAIVARTRVTFDRIKTKVFTPVSSFAFAFVNIPYAKLSIITIKAK